MDFILGLGLVAYDTDMTESLSLRLKQDEYFIEAMYDNAEIRVLGQGMGDANIYSLSVGYESPITSVISPYISVGYAQTDKSIVADIQTEMVYTHLVGRHGVEGHEIPVRKRPNRGETTGIHTDYDIDGGFIFKTGVNFLINEDWSASMGYRYFKPDEYWKLWDDKVVEKCNCWWQEKITRDFSALEFNVRYTF